MVNKSMYDGPTGLKFSVKGQLLKGNRMAIKFFRKSKILHFLGVKSEFYQSETDETHSSPKILTFGSKMAVFNMQRISASSFIPI